MNSIAKNIKELRTEKGWTQQQLADMLFVTRQAVSNWENGKTEPDADTLIKIAQVMQADINDIIGCSTVEKGEKSSTTNKINIATAILAFVVIILLFFRYFYPLVKNYYFDNSIIQNYDIRHRYDRIEYRFSFGYLTSAALLETLLAVLIMRLLKIRGKIKPVKSTAAVKIIRFALITAVLLHSMNMILPDIDFIFGLNLLNKFHQAVNPILKILGYMRLAAFYPHKRWIFLVIGAVIELLKTDNKKEW